MKICLLGWVSLRVLCKKCFSGTEWYKAIIGVDDLERLVHLHQKIGPRMHSIKAKFKLTWLGSEKVAYIFNILGLSSWEKYFMIFHSQCQVSLKSLQKNKIKYTVCYKLNPYVLTKT